MFATVLQMLTHARDLLGHSWIRVLTTSINWLACLWFAWRFLDTTRSSEADPMILGPLDGLSALLALLDVPGGASVSAASAWLSDPERTPLIIAAAIGSGVAASFAARRPSSPLALGTVVLLLIAIDGGGVTATWWTAGVVLLPAAVAVVLAVTSYRSRWDDRPAYLVRATTDHVIRAAFAYVFVLLTPVMLIAALVELHRVDAPDDEPHDLARNAGVRLMAGSADDKRAALQATIVAAAVLSASDAEGRVHLTAALQDLYDGPTGAIPTSFPRK